MKLRKLKLVFDIDNYSQKQEEGEERNEGKLLTIFLNIFYHTHRMWFACMRIKNQLNIKCFEIGFIISFLFE